MEPLDLPTYVTHAGTVKVAGGTVPRKAAWCAFAFMEERRVNVEFLFIGASAGQQALKAIGILTEIFESRWGTDYALVFRPMRFKTAIHSQTEQVPDREVDAQVWRAHVLDLSKLQ
jgi:stage V sporulation protein SpoVS